MPRFIKQKIKSFIRRAVPFNAHSILAALYSHSKPIAQRPDKLVWKRPTLAPLLPGQSFPLPPATLRMGYGDDDNDYLQIGDRTANMLRRLLADAGVVLAPGDRALDWGCASGRVLRQFAPEVKSGCEFWGVDQDAPHIDWCKAALAPPFKFGTCSAYPHLPFEDNTFKFIYAISVFTHLVDLIDAWLLELRRILVPGGIGIFTIHDEHTFEFFRQNPDHPPEWMRQHAHEGLSGDIDFHILRPDWGHTLTFFKTEYLRKEWGSYFEIVAIIPRAEVFQTAVVVRKMPSPQKPHAMLQAMPQ